MLSKKEIAMIEGCGVDLDYEVVGAWLWGWDFID
jgi:hypothetical protein